MKFSWASPLWQFLAGDLQVGQRQVEKKDGAQVLEFGQDIGPVKVENAVGFGPAVAEILDLDAQFIVQLPEQALLEHQDLFLGGLG